MSRILTGLQCRICTQRFTRITQTRQFATQSKQAANQRIAHLSDAEQTAVDLARREALLERKSLEKQLNQQQTTPNNQSHHVPVSHSHTVDVYRHSTSSTETPRSSKLPALLPPDNAPRKHTSFASFPSAFDSLVPMSTSGQPDVLTDEDKAEQMALIDELTDYLRAYRQPTSDQSNKASNEVLVLDEEGFFLDKPRTTQNFNRLIHNHVKAHAVEKGLALETRMKTLGVQLNDQTYAALMLLCGAVPKSVLAVPQRKQELVDRVFGFYDSMIASRITPTLQSLNTMVHALSSLQDFQAAKRALSLIKEHNIAPNDSTYTSLISCYRQPDVSHEMVESLWFELRNYVAEPDAISYNTMIRACAHHGEVEHALALYTEMKQWALQVSGYTYAGLMYACARRPDFYVKCFDLFDQALVNQYKPDKVLMSTMLFACQVNADLSNAVKIFEMMQHQNIERDTIAYNTMLATIAATQPQQTYELVHSKLLLSQRERHAMAERLLIQMEATNVPIDSTTVVNALSCWTRSFRLKVSEDMRESLIDRYLRSDDSVDQEDLKARGEGEFNPKLWEVMIDMYTHVKRLPEAMSKLEDARMQGIQISARSYEEVLRLCAKFGAEAEGQAVYHAMRDAGFEPRDQELSRLFDPIAYRAWLKKQQQTASTGYVAPMDAQERRSMRESAFFGDTKIPKKLRDEPVKPKWRVSRQQQKSMEREELDRRLVDRARIQERQ